MLPWSVLISEEEGEFACCPSHVLISEKERKRSLEKLCVVRTGLYL